MLFKGSDNQRTQLKISCFRLKNRRSRGKKLGAAGAELRLVDKCPRDQKTERSKYMDAEKPEGITPLVGVT